jgi:hypothetical protein
LVNLDAVSAKLLQKGVPVQLVRQLYYINSSAVKLPRKVRLNEFEHMIKGLIQRGGTPDEVIMHPRPIGYTTRLRGVPQGAPTSPLLATLCLEGSILDRPDLPAVMYADDGLYYGDNIEDIPKITPNSGIVTANIHFNLDKTG